MWSLAKFLWGTALNNLRDRGVPLPKPKQGGDIMVYEPGKEPYKLGDKTKGKGK